MPSPTLSVGAFLSGLVLAQNNSAGNNGTCTGNWQRDNPATGPINSTGSQSFTWPFVANINQDDVKPWYISVLVNNTNLSRDNRGTISWPFLSVPDGVEASACVYQFGSQNATSTGDVDGAIGCGGIFTAKCIEYLRESLLNNTNGLSGKTPRCNLPSLTDGEQKRRKEACGDIGGSFSSVPMRDVGNASTCPYDQLSGVDLPKDYLSRQIGVSISPYADQVYHNDLAYNLSVTQSTTFAVVAAFQADNIVQKDVSFVCITPNNTQPGSSLPENNTPWKTSDAGAPCKATRGLSVWMAFAVGLMFAL